MAGIPKRGDSLSVVIVTYNSGDKVLERLAVLDQQLGPEDEIIVVDNASADGTPDRLAASGMPLTLISNPENTGFAAACNQGAARSSGSVLLFLNPDVVPQPGALDALRGGSGWDVWQGLVLLPDGETVNTAGGELHYLGIGWAGLCGQPRTAAGAAREVAFASGACLMIRRETWDVLGGFADDYFMYCEDVDLSLRARLLGGRVGIEPSAAFIHDYEFHKGPDKWRLLERNRWFTILRTYPRPLLLAVLPALLVSELALTAYALLSGWGRSKLRAQGEVVSALPRLMRQRRKVLASAVVPPAEFARHMRAELDSPHAGRPARIPLLRALPRAYWRLARALTGA